ncbi:hypothetical protein F511_21121 [Dorcoceras hygrometricum]|uniref:Uncharacterized protein n=1 Tax=Dorcoceras hygrometricum TaxID=472368 RepID=A0A2Z7B4J7_9LAMI|nr:hypothetical protein F511_21121 [Dorcoceras hygrometricum]
MQQLSATSGAHQQRQASNCRNGSRTSATPSHGKHRACLGRATHRRKGGRRLSAVPCATMCAPLRDAAPSLTRHARPARMVPARACARGAREGAAACGGGRWRFFEIFDALNSEIQQIVVDYRQSGPRPDPRLLRQAALEALTRSARTNTPRKTRPEQFPTKLVGGGGGAWAAAA